MNFFDDSVELQHEKNTDASERRALGQFFTPYPVALYMAGVLLEGVDRIKNKCILDPASGLAVFQRAIVSLAGKEMDFVNYEIDPALSEKQKKYLDQVGASFIVKSGDYLKDFHRRKQFDLVIANPPYIKHINIADKKSINRRFNSSFGCGLDVSTNYYCYFIVKALSEIKKGGRAVFILPGEFLNSNYGVGLKNYLVKEGSIRKLICFDNAEVIFRDSLTQPVIVLFEKKQHASVDFIRLSKKDNGFVESSPVPCDIKRLDPEGKWKMYFHAPRNKFRCLVPFDVYARARRGIATGANSFFILTEQQRVSYGIGLRHVRKCVSKSCHVNGNAFGNREFELLKKADKKVWLMSLNDYPPGSDANVEKYVKYGEREGFDKKYLTRNRTPWYNTENSPAGDLWISTFSRDRLKFIINRDGISSLTCFHSVIFKRSFKRYLYFFMGYFLSSVAKDILSAAMREHGNGLFKLEPNDLNSSYLPDLSAFSPTEISEVSAAAEAVITDGDKNRLEHINHIFSSRISAF